MCARANVGFEGEGVNGEIAPSSDLCEGCRRSSRMRPQTHDSPVYIESTVITNEIPEVFFGGILLEGAIIVVSRNPIVRGKLESAAARMDIPCLMFDGFTRIGDVLAAAAVVVDLDVPGWDGAVEIIRERWPRALAASFISMPDRERWDAATVTYDLVATRGAIAAQLTAKLATWDGPPSGLRIRLFEERDAAGRLGMVHRQQTSAGPIAVYHVGSRFCAVRDVCPHAGATLSDGTIEGTIITCPLHGSQFDVCSGDRVRGPSDDPIPSYPVVVSGGIVYLELEEDS